MDEESPISFDDNAEERVGRSYYKRGRDSGYRIDLKDLSYEYNGKVHGWRSIKHADFSIQAKNLEDLVSEPHMIEHLKKLSPSKTFNRVEIVI